MKDQTIEQAVVALIDRLTADLAALRHHATSEAGQRPLIMADVTVVLRRAAKSFNRAVAPLKLKHPE